MSQSKRQSLLESLANVLAGYGVAVLSVDRAEAKAAIARAKGEVKS